MNNNFVKTYLSMFDNGCCFCGVLFVLSSQIAYFPMELGNIADINIFELRRDVIFLFLKS